MRMNVPIEFNVSDLSRETLESFKVEIEKELAFRYQMRVHDQELAMAKGGDRIGAIKSIKARTNCPLRDALDLLDRAQGLIK